ncbi:hypothetical protein SLS62_010337 [Diatrype stigma]|uniref:Uncharacterized protein n=1 Tax=Diatrype stigma TaxID=117547 RepID=A0AAN9UA59_9PEZI
MTQATLGEPADVARGDGRVRLDQLNDQALDKGRRRVLLPSAPSAEDEGRVEVAELVQEGVTRACRAWNV